VSDVHQEIVRFKIGEGGSSGGLPITPDPTFRDIQGEGTALAGGGTCEFTNGSAIVAGSGTSFLADVAANEWIKPGPTPSSNPESAGTPGSEEDIWGKVQSVDSDIQITLSTNYVGTTHLFAESRPCHKSTAPLFTFRKTLGASDVLFDSAVPAITEITSIVAAGEANLDQLGGNPVFYEVGIFDALGVMVVYMTFDAQTKTGAIQLNHIVDLIF
jgi:hypothetical protein